MKNLLSFITFSILVSLLSSCTKQIINKENDYVSLSERNVVQSIAKLDKRTKLEVEKVISATAIYADFAKAVEDGYTNVLPFMPYVGNRIIQEPPILEFNMLKPCFLIYEETTNEIDLKLAGVGYMVSMKGTSGEPIPPPEGFYGDDDIWTASSDDKYWVLHAWIIKNNPDGFFHFTNPESNHK